ncbi:MAG: gliding motility-associated C-terminal domain-containing protein [Bacteroidota bacterium]
MKIRILFVLLLPVSLGFGQGNIFNFWHFGQNAGINFNGGLTAITNSQLNTSEGTASISDENGALLFYTEGVNIWDRNNNLMANGTGLTGNVSTTQSVLIVQQPGSTTLYYVFTVPPDQGGDLSYSVVDMTLNGGLGDVVPISKNTAMPSRALTTCEKITAIRHCNNIDWWIVTHDQSAAGSNNYRVWLLDDTGVVSAPVVSSVGTAVTTSDPLVNHGYGYLTASNNGEKMIMASYGMDLLDLVDFDNTTGIVSNAQIITGVTKPYGTEFSPNDEILYVSSDNMLLQFDLTLPDIAQIQASQGIIHTDFNEGAQIRAIRMGPDNRIYVSTSWSPFLGAVNSPDVLGAGCNFNATAVDVSDGGNILATTALGLPNSYKFGNPCGPSGLLASFTPSQTSICVGDCITMTDNSSGTITGWSWQFANGTPSTGSGQNPGQVCFHTAGPQNITLTITDGTLSDDTTIVISVNSLPVVTASAVPSSTVCEGDSLALSGEGAASFTWDNGVVDGDYFVPAASITYTVTGTDANTCQNTASITVLLTDCDQESIGVPAAFSPDGDGNNDMLFVKGNNIETLSFMVYNRYGQKVFETDSQATGWDGKFKGKEENPGVFVWVAEYTFTGGSGGVIKGNTTLIR